MALLCYLVLWISVCSALGGRDLGGLSVGCARREGGEVEDVRRVASQRAPAALYVKVPHPDGSISAP